LSQTVQAILSGSTGDAAWRLYTGSTRCDDTVLPYCRRLASGTAGRCDGMSTAATSTLESASASWSAQVAARQSTPSSHMITGRFCCSCHSRRNRKRGHACASQVAPASGAQVLSCGLRPSSFLCDAMQAGCIGLAGVSRTHVRGVPQRQLIFPHPGRMQPRGIACSSGFALLCQRSRLYSLLSEILRARLHMTSLPRRRAQGPIVVVARV
jgi:hypothetical protein